MFGIRNFRKQSRIPRDFIRFFMLISGISKHITDFLGFVFRLKIHEVLKSDFQALTIVLWTEKKLT